ncbi:hypothetical protein [Streptomyces sp. NBC_00343]|uniref:hypothetical protein n=1 Tax=Streptomyces sp. NBC_00343 TaxID=2975719 RepID=UPI002E2E28FD|nr:hypothetical protein [Streptomyces sp. NBC_00343]
MTIEYKAAHPEETTRADRAPCSHCSGIPPPRWPWSWASPRGAAAAGQTRLIEVALDLHGHVLATTLGVSGADTTGPPSSEEGTQATQICRKGR